MYRILIFVASAVFALAALAACAAEDSDRSAGRVAASPATYAPDGRLTRPSGYRSWVYVGSPLTPNDMNDGKAAFPEFHSVYVDPGSYTHYQRTGNWRDGTVLVKELVTVGSKAASSGAGYFMGEFAGLEAAVKDSKRFSSEPGGWSYFRFTDESGGRPHRAASAMPTAACAACHQATAAEDMVFTQYYPVLRAAKNRGRQIPEDL